MYKINQGIERLDTKSEIYKHYMKKANQYELNVKQERLEKETLKTTKKSSAFSPQLAIPGPSTEGPIVTVPTSESSTTETGANEDEDKLWNIDPRDYFPGTTNLKIGPAKVFENVSLKEFANHEELLDIAERPNDSEDYLRGDVDSGKLNPADWPAHVYFASRNENIDRRKAGYKQFIVDLKKKRKEKDISVMVLLLVLTISSTMYLG